MKLSLELTFISWDFTSILVFYATVVLRRELVLVNFGSFFVSSFGKCSSQAFDSFYENFKCGI